MRPPDWSTGSSTARGYGAEWRRKRKRILARDGHLCQCAYCKSEGRTSVATEVDHVVSRANAERLGWSKERIEHDSNLQAINRDCHARKTAEEQGYSPARRIGLDGFPIDAASRTAPPKYPIPNTVDC